MLEQKNEEHKFICKNLLTNKAMSAKAIYTCSLSVLWKILFLEYFEDNV